MKAISGSVNRRSKEETLLKREMTGASAFFDVSEADLPPETKNNIVDYSTGDGKKSTTMASEKETTQRKESGSSKPHRDPQRGPSRPQSPPRHGHGSGHRHGRPVHRRRHKHGSRLSQRRRFHQLCTQWGPGVRSWYGEDINIVGRITIHGLYSDPEVEPRSRPAFDTSLLERDSSLILRATQSWPNVRQPSDVSLLNGNPSPHNLWLWGHEWDEHGVCSGKSQPKYMKFTIRWFERVEFDTNDILRSNCNSDGILDVHGFMKAMRKTNRKPSIHVRWRTYVYYDNGIEDTFEQQELLEVRFFCRFDSGVPVSYLPQMVPSSYNSKYSIFVLRV